MSRFFVHSNRLRWSSQVLALADESTYDSQRSYLCLFPESSPIANLIASLLSCHETSHKGKTIYWRNQLLPNRLSLYKSYP